MSKVFIIELPRRYVDTSKAEEFGEIVYVFLPTSRRCSVWEHVHFGETVLQRLKELNFNPWTDYVCIVGALVTVTIALITIAQSYDEFNVLLFNSVSGAYVQKRFERKGQKNETENKAITNVG